ncbi:MAG TPA: hypothetical protein PK251_14570 [Candidatus Latescibacteria bacterium]|nr:hypothetical protein [Candidatus Latescibacterota bacterium]HOS65963.1 hypothetical protein [Candidatus Latescibacterota bacterium]HPK75945.1 hypothetical protein [Candidatus Latescibacterota bacterium]
MKRVLFALLVVVALFAGCEGPMGPQGPKGDTGATGATGPAGAVFEVFDGQLDANGKATIYIDFGNDKKPAIVWVGIAPATGNSYVNMSLEMDGTKYNNYTVSFGNTLFTMINFPSFPYWYYRVIVARSPS